MNEEKKAIAVSIVEDDVKVRGNLARLVDSTAGFVCVSQHPDAENALKDLPISAPEVVLMDINLPGMNGVDCVRRLKELLPKIQVVMLTVYENTNIIFSALSVAVLSFLGFDAISTLAEEAKGGARVVGKATMIALCIAAVLFIAQTYIAALLVPDQTAFAGDTATNDAFYNVSAIVGGSGLKVVVAMSAALSAAIANALVAQAATARLLFAMARDGQLPRFLAHVHPTRRVPDRAVLFVSAVSLVLGLFFVGQVGLLSSLVNFGALFSFLMLHVSVVFYFLIKQRGRSFGTHLVSPVIGFVIIAFVLLNADVHAKVGGIAWLAIGAIVLVGLRLAGRSVDLKLEPQIADAEMP